MDEFNISLSLILELAANQAAQYYEDCRYMSGKVYPIILHGMPNRKKVQYEQEMIYWDSIFVKLTVMQTELAKDGVDFTWDIRKLTNKGD